MSTQAAPFVEAAEVEQWVQLIFDLIDVEAACDIGGGVAPATINEHADRERAISTIHRHLEQDERVETTQGVHKDGHGGPRTSYVPTADSYERLVVDGGRDPDIAAVHLRQARENHPHERGRELLREAEQLLEADR